jgi:hypothetical protein
MLFQMGVKCQLSHITKHLNSLPLLVRLQKGCTRLTAASDKAHHLLAHGRWFSSGTPASSNTKTGRHDIIEVSSTFHILDLGKIWHFYVDNFCVPTIKYIICIIFKIIVFFIITLFARLYVEALAVTFAKDQTQALHIPVKSFSKSVCDLSYFRRSAIRLVSASRKVNNSYKKV